MLTSNEIIMRLLLGTLFGGVIGFERQVHGRPAGFRTHILVCIAAVLIMLVSEYYQYLSSIDPSYVRIDPGRIAAGALAGVGFLGAGVVLKAGLSIQGLTTAACIWVVSAIGLAIVIALFRNKATAHIDEVKEMRG
jgi:putative Mg2+ transporter-C (MgtC) family protein